MNRILHLLIPLCITATIGCADESSKAVEPEPTDMDVEETEDAEDEDDVRDPGQNNGEGATYRPHWILRDANGDQVQAMVQPLVLSNGAEASLDSFDAIDCVTVQSMGDARWPDLRYNLETGEMAPCYREVGARFSDANCTERVAFGKHAVVPVDGTLMIGTEKRSPPFYIDGSSGDCIETSYSSGWALEPVPDNMKNALSNAPYTLTVEY